MFARPHPGGEQALRSAHQPPPSWTQPPAYRRAAYVQQSDLLPMNGSEASVHLETVLTLYELWGRCLFRRATPQRYRFPDLASRLGDPGA
jgi:hypothetical protein